MKNIMKQILLFIVILLLSSATCKQIHAQVNQVEKVLLKGRKNLQDTSELKFQGEVYKYFKKSQYLKNTNVYKHEGQSQEHWKAKNLKETGRTIYYKVFSKKRIQELVGEKLLISCTCDQKGTPRELVFHLKHAPNVTLEELAALEKAFKQHKIELIGTVETTNHYFLAFVCDFTKLLINSY